MGKKPSCGPTPQQGAIPSSVREPTAGASARNRLSHRSPEGKSRLQKVICPCYLVLNVAPVDPPLLVSWYHGMVS